MNIDFLLLTREMMKVQRIIKIVGYLVFIYNNVCWKYYRFTKRKDMILEMHIV